MDKVIPKAKYSNMNDISLAVSCAAGKPVYYETETDKQIKQHEANKFIRENLKIKKHKYYKVDDRIKLKHFHITKDAIMLVAGKYVYVKGETYFSFEDIDINEKVVSVWFLSDDDALLY